MRRHTDGLPEHQDMHDKVVHAPHHTPKANGCAECDDDNDGDSDAGVQDDNEEG